MDPGASSVVETTQFWYVYSVPFLRVVTDTVRHDILVPLNPGKVYKYVVTSKFRLSLNVSIGTE